MDDFVAAYKKMFENYFEFSGRSSRADFCGAIVMNILVGFLLAALSWMLPLVFFADWAYGIAVIIPLTALTVRRLHDMNKSGWWVLVGLFPVLNLILVIFCCFSDGTPGSNAYGA